MSVLNSHLSIFLFLFFFFVYLQGSEKKEAYPILARGTDFKFEAPSIKPKIIYLEKAEAPDGSGLAFGGLSQLDWDPNPGTFVKQGGKWVNISKRMKKNNSLQPLADEILQLRTAFKNSLSGFRHLFFEGGSKTKENEALDKNARSILDNTKKAFDELLNALKKEKGRSEYQKQQIKFALLHLERARTVFVSVKVPVDSIQIKEMWNAILGLEKGAESLSAEPLPRVYHVLAYDNETKVYVLFGGDHFDYLLNDVWIFDPKKQRWRQRHTDQAPEPRALPHYHVDGGTLTLEGGFVYKVKPYWYGSRVTVHVGPGKWHYDIAKNTWTGESGLPGFVGGTRTYREAKNKQSPDYYLGLGKPNAFENEMRLKGLPVNTWVQMKGPSFSLGHDWGTVAYDSDRDLLLHWGGGHSSNPGGEVLHYHLATNRWEMTWPVEWTVAHLYSTTLYPRGVSYNQRPFITMHAYHGYAYDPLAKNMILTARVQSWGGVLDPYYYLYDSATAEWMAQHAKHNLMNGANELTSSDLRSHGKEMLFWVGNNVLTLDRKKNQWIDLRVKGMPIAATDGTGSCYDSKRDRALFTTLLGWKQPFLGQIWALDMKTKKIKRLSPKGMEHVPSQAIIREAVYHEKADLFLWSQMGKDGMLAYEPEKNQWEKIILKNQPTFGYSVGSVYDSKRELIWLIYNGGHVFVLRLDEKTLKREALGVINSRSNDRASSGTNDRHGLERIKKRAQILDEIERI